MNVRAQTIGEDNVRIANDIMTKVANESKRTIERAVEILQVVDLVEGPEIIGILQAVATPGVKLLSSADWPPAAIAAVFVLVAALDGRKREDKPVPSENALVPAMRDFEEALQAPLRRFIDL